MDMFCWHHIWHSSSLCDAANSIGEYDTHCKYCACTVCSVFSVHACTAGFLAVAVNSISL